MTNIVERLLEETDVVPSFGQLRREAADTITELRRELAAARYGEALQTELKKNLSEQLSAEQANSQQLREALLLVEQHLAILYPNGVKDGDALCCAVTLATNFPHDDTALKQALAAERERVALMVLGGSFLHDKAPTALFAKEVAAAIRSLT